MRYLRAAPGDPLPFKAYADFFDGDTAAARRVTLTIDEVAQVLVIEVPEEPPVSWPFDTIRALPDQAGEEALIVTSDVQALARLTVSNSEALREIITRSPALDRRPPVRGMRRVIAWAMGAVASVALIVTVLVPLISDQLAAFLPPEGERALGDTTLQQVREALDGTGFGALRICENSQGVAALAVMEDRLLAGQDLPYPLTVTVLDHPLINAFALPGGHVVFFRGLIDAAEAPEEVAAVFAHEVGHVVARDPTRIALRSAGSIGVLGLLLGDFAGGAVVLFLAERLIQADYTQSAEAGADVFAHDMLARAQVSPAALGDMFERLRAEHGDADGIVAHFLSHPALGDRIAAAEAAGGAMSGPTRPILSEEDWADLQAICE